MSAELFLSSWSFPAHTRVQRCPNASWTLMIIWLLWDEMHHYLHLMSVKVEQNPLWRPLREPMAELEFGTQSSAHSPGWNHFPLGSAEQPWLSLTLQFWTFIMPVRNHSTGNLTKLNQKTRPRLQAVVLGLKQQKQMLHLNRLFNGMIKLNEMACFCCPNASFFSLWNPHFFLVTSSLYPLGRTLLMLGQHRATLGMTIGPELVWPHMNWNMTAQWNVAWTVPSAFLWWDLGT